MPGKMTQVEYIAILLEDNGIFTAAQRKGWFEKRFNKSFADELTRAEASLAIDELKEGRGDYKTCREDEQ